MANRRTRRPGLLAPLLYVPRLEELARTAVLLSPEVLMHILDSIYEDIAQPPPSHFCFLRLAPLPVQERFRKYIKVSQPFPRLSLTTSLISWISGVQESLCF